MNDGTEASPMRVKALLPYFGGKRTLAPRIVAELGPHTQYFEPFCGSLAVIFAKKPAQKETVNDLHGDAMNLARVVQDETMAQRLYERLRRTLFTEGMLEDAEDYLDVPPEGVSEPRAYWYFVKSWMGRNGTAGVDRDDYQIAVRWTKNGGSPTVRFQHAAESIPAWHARLRNVVILQRDALQIIDRFEDVPETAIYCDPPYLAETRSVGALDHGRGGRYKHDFTDNDHVRLSEVLGRYKRARVVLSYYDCPRLRELYAGWTFVSHARQKHLHAQNGRGARKQIAPEVLILNGPSYAQ